MILHFGGAGFQRLIPVNVCQSRTEETEAVKKLKMNVSTLAGELNGVQFNYTPPSRDFDRSRVKGVVARLFKVKDRTTMTALEVFLPF